MILSVSFWLLGLAVPIGTEEPRVVPGSTCKLAQLTGERDVSRGILTRSRTQSSAGLIGTDLGSSFEHDGKLYFLFGDSIGGTPNADVLAWSDAVTPDALTLSFHTGDDGKFERLEVPGVSSGAFEVPSYGISLDGTMYVVVTTDHSERNTMGRSVLARSSDDGRTFERLCDLSTTHFVNVAMDRSDGETRTGLPFEDCVFVWGSGRYRASNARLACAPTQQFGELSSWRYFAGLSNGEPRWEADEAKSIDLFDHAVIGELSVAWIAPLERWVMLYNSSEPRGIVMRTAQAPWGPWSDLQVVFDPWLDHGYASFMHVDWRTARMDEIHDPGRHEKFGGEYGPYLIPRFTSGDSNRCTLVFTMSTWNPYQVVLMSTEVGRVPEGSTSDSTSILLGAPPCVSEGSEVVRFERNGRPYISTYGAGGDADLVVSHLPIRPVEGSSLSFSIHGGRSRVVLVLENRPPPDPIKDIPGFERMLMSGAYGPVLESIAGPANNDVDIGVRWNLSRHAGKSLRLYLVDASTERWGFLSVSELKSSRPSQAR